MRPLGLAMIVLVLGVLAFGLWYQSRYPREIIGTSTLVVESRKAGAQRLTLLVRTVRINRREFEEIRLPNGTWIDCGGDCRAAARAAGDEFWDQQERPRR